MNIENFTTQDNDHKVTSEDIFAVCRDLTASGEKVTGAKVRKGLIAKYGVSCHNSFLHDNLRNYKKSLQLTKNDFDTDKLENELQKYQTLSLPKPIEDLSRKAFHYSLSIVSDYVASQESSQLVANLQDENEFLRSQIEKLQKENYELRAIVNFTQENKLPQQNATLKTLLTSQTINTSQELEQEQIDDKLLSYEDENDNLPSVESDEFIEPYLQKDSQKLTIYEFQEFYYSFNDRKTLLEMLISLGYRLGNGHKPTPKVLKTWISEYTNQDY